MGDVNPAISVIVPTYNRAASLVEAVRSALGQSLSPLEVLVCDDGSTDASREAVAALADGRVRWLDCGRSGRPAPPRNRGLEAARGEWVAFLDDDDVWHPNKLEVQAARLGDDCHAVSANARRIGPQGGDLGLIHSTCPPKADAWALLSVNWVVTSGAVVRRRLALDCGGFPEAPALRSVEDYALWLRVGVRAPWELLFEPLLDYRDAPEQGVRQGLQGRSWALRRAVMGDFLGWCLGPGGATRFAPRVGRSWVGAAARAALGRR